jgi:hypothetical protein
MVIMFLLGATATLGATASIYLAVLHVVDQEHRLRSDRLLRKQGGSLLGRAWARVGAAWSGCCCCCAGARRRQRRRRGGGARESGGDDPEEGMAGGGAAQAGHEGGGAGEVGVRVESGGAADGGDLTAPLLPGAGEEGAQQQPAQPQQQTWGGWVLGYATLGYYGRG